MKTVLNYDDNSGEYEPKPVIKYLFVKHVQSDLQVVVVNQQQPEKNQIVGEADFDLSRYGKLANLVEKLNFKGDYS